MERTGDTTGGAELLTSSPPFPFFVGCGRSGTTLVRSMFDSHPDMAVVYESFFASRLLRHRRRYEGPGAFNLDRFTSDLTGHFGFRKLGLSPAEVGERLSEETPATTADALRTVYATYAGRQGKSRYGDKTPMYVNVVPVLAGALPEARFVHIVRDGRNVALAYLQAPWGPASLVEACLYWKHNVERGRRAGRRLGPERYREVAYEHLTEDPEAVLRELCPFLELDFDPAMLCYFERTEEVMATIRNRQHHQGLSKPVTRGVRDWRTQMAPGDVRTFEALAGPLLDELGYERSSRGPTMGVRAGAQLGRLRVEAGRAGRRVGKQRRRAGRGPAAETRQRRPRV